jgi:hypothetical protein
VTHGDERFTDDSHPLVRRESLPPRFHSADDRVLDGDHASIGFTLVDGPQGAGESGNRNLLDWMPPYLGDRALGVGAAIALKCYAHRRASGVTGAVRSRC